MKGLIKVITLVVLLLFASKVYAWDNICDVAKETPYMTSVNLKDFYDDKMKGRLFEGSGFVKNVWQYGVNKYHAVRVDCGNDVIVNVSTSSDMKDLKVGQSVSFDGTCISYSRRRYVDTQKVYMIYELDRGSVK